jgi:signal transduction histidine kinase
VTNALVRPRVLVAEADRAARAPLVELLNVSFDAEPIADSDALVLAARDAPPAAIVTSAHMPGLTPEQLVQALRDDERTRFIPLILLAAPSELAHTMQAGAADVVTLPWNDVDLLARVRAQIAVADYRARMLEAERARAAETAALLERAQAMEVELQRSNADLEQFAYVASHDLQEPLRMIASFVQLLQRRYEGKLDADADRWIGHVVNGAQRMKTLIEDLLRYSRVGKKPEPFTDLSLDDVLARVRDDLRSVVAESGATIDVQGPLPHVLGNEGQLTQVFENLVGNAIKFRGDAPPKIDVAATRSGANVEVTVRDNGIGIEPQYFERIFVVFQRLHGQQIPGTGMGLAISKKIVERHGGRIWLESQPGSGSTFRFTLRASGPPSASASASGAER